MVKNVSGNVEVAISGVDELAKLGAERLAAALFKMASPDAVYSAIYQMYRIIARERGITQDEFDRLATIALVRQGEDGTPMLMHLVTLIRVYSGLDMLE